MKITPMKQLTRNLVLTLATYGVSLAVANAALVTYTDRASFEAQGKIAENYGFELPWGPSGGTVCVPPCLDTVTYTTNGVTYQGESVIYRPDSTFIGGRIQPMPASNMLGYKFNNPVRGSMAGRYNMFGVDLGNLVITSNGPVAYTLITSAATYVNTVTVPSVKDRPGTTFLGFTLSPGETFVSFVFDASGSGALAAIDNVTLGNFATDFGDAPNTTAGTASGNYNTLTTNNGPSHLLGQPVYLGSVAPDADSGTLQNVGATADDNTGTDDEDGIPTQPWILTSSTSVAMTVNATNKTASPATLACWIDFNHDGDFLDAGEKAPAVSVPANTNTAPYVLNFSGFAAPLPGITYVRCRIALNAAEVATPTGPALSGEVEDHALWIPTPGESDYGDAPDNGASTGHGSYNTTAARNGPSHALGQAVFLGGIAADADNGTLQNATATADNNAAIDDEDGVPPSQLPAITTTGTSNKMKVTATNLTGSAALLACWIDFNRNGVFENGNGEFATIPVAANSGTQSYSLTYSGYVTPLATGRTYVRCRISTDAAWTASPLPTGPASNGEVEDYAVDIFAACKLSPISTVVAAPPLLNGVRFTIMAGPPINNIASVQCQKTVNIDPATGVTFVPAASAAPAGNPPTWLFSPPQAQVEITARKATSGSATLACTVADDAMPANVCSTDPVIEEIVRVKGQAVTLKANNGEPLSANFRYVKVANGSPGLSELEVGVNGAKFKLTQLKDNTSQQLDIASALRPGDNFVTLTAKGRPGSMASVYLSDEPLQ